MSSFCQQTILPKQNVAFKQKEKSREFYTQSATVEEKLISQRNLRLTKIFNGKDFTCNPIGSTFNRHTYLPLSDTLACSKSTELTVRTKWSTFHVEENGMFSAIRSFLSLSNDMVVSSLNLALNVQPLIVMVSCSRYTFFDDFGLRKVVGFEIK